ncbi:MAG: hypothetical protein RL076_2728 [Chloroflexota bacterium]|jgi:hypothetical protein
MEWGMMNEYAVVVFGVVTGVALSAVAGVRIFLPFLVAAIAVKLGIIEVANDFAWISSWPALAVFATAALTEVLAYYIPVIDHALDVLGSPAAIVAGSLLTASMVVGMDEWLRWSLAIIAGGGIAGSLHVGKTLLRGASTATTAGLANPLLATGEMIGSTLVAIAAIWIPVVVVVLAIIMLILLARAIIQRRNRQLV